MAVEVACKKMVKKLKPFLKLARKLAAQKGKDAYDWFDLVTAGFKGTAPFWEADFTTLGFYRPEFKDVLYETYGAAVAEVEMDVLTGETKPLYTYIMFDCAPCLNPTVDIGQIEGAYIMGLGQIALEQRLVCPKTGRLLTDNTWTYKPPTIYDIPEEFHVDVVDLRSQEANNGWNYINSMVSAMLHTMGVMAPATKNVSKAMKSSRAVGEPPVLFSYALLGAMRQAVGASGRVDAKSLTMPIPATPEALAKITWAEERKLAGVMAAKEQKEGAGVEAEAAAASSPEGWEPGKVVVGYPIGPRGFLGMLVIASAVGGATYYIAKKLKYF
mmetsp:Transcript_3895/g.7495  ORF Transcript_3895/g.7495 Transcript_3895/m.7495 type:complete len:328 (-) Transcript_3895:567-1550(-)